MDLTVGTVGPYVHELRDAGALFPIATPPEGGRESRSNPKAWPMCSEGGTA
jgi:hypothetical protein